MKNLCDIVEDVNGTRPDVLDRLKYLVQWQTETTENGPFDCLDNSHEETMNSFREMNTSR